MMAASVAALTLLAGCGSGDGTADGNTVGDVAAAPPVSNDWALKYTGGTAGAAAPAQVVT